MLTSIQIFLLFFIVFAISRVILRLREKVLTVQAGFFWIIVWLSALVMILLPTSTTQIASLFGVGRGVDVILYVSLALLFYLVFRGYVMIEDMRHDITTIVREISLNNPIKHSRRSRKKSSK